MIILRKNCDRRIRKGHLWVFSNEIADPSVAELEPGEIRELRDSAGEFMGMVYVNPASLITARILSRRRVAIDGSFIEERLRSALALRERLFPSRDAYRLVFGESDLLPGLIIDRYGEYLAVQSLTAGMDRLQGEVIEALVRIFAPAGIYLRNDSPIRTLEGLETEKGLAYGSVPEIVRIGSGSLSFLVDIPNGQKTGFFLDQESNRAILRDYVKPGDRVLDLFCYTGAWGIHAAAAGAEVVVGVDTSRGALALASENAVLNGVAERYHAVRDEAVEFLKKTHESWDLVIVDPPAFAKSRGRLKDGLKGYIDVNRRALTHMSNGGVLITCSCSHHLSLPDFESVLLSASHQAGRALRILEQRGQSPDHPVLLTMPETRYLKVIVAEIM